MLENISQDTSSLDTTLENDGITPLQEILGNEKIASPFNDSFFNNICSILKESLTQLNFREMKIVELRYGLNGEGPLTLEDIGEKLGITRERVRQIQKKALSKLREFDQIKELQAVI
jgi:RNA polymerase primary sigma factor